MGKIQNCEKIPRFNERTECKGGQKMRFVIVECHLCQKKIIKLVEKEDEEEKIMQFCRKHFKYICKNCEWVLGKCFGCAKVFCKECEVHKPDDFRVFCEDCYMFYLAFEKGEMN